MPTLDCVLEIRTSHGRNEAGFGSSRNNVAEGGLELRDIVLWGESLTQLSLKPEGASVHLRAHADALDNDRALKFLDAAEAALTAYWGLTEHNVYYGAAFVEANRTTMRLEPDPLPGGEHLTVHDSFSMTITQRLGITDQAHLELIDDPLRRLYADGLRASSPESKFFHWFVIIEEFLERSTTLNASFAKLFSPEQAEIVEACAKNFSSQSRHYQRIMDILSTTADGRVKKLKAIFDRLNLALPTSPPLSVTDDLCRRLIDQRNRLFHKGTSVEESLVYNALFPIVTALARRSTEIIALA